MIYKSILQYASPNITEHLKTHFYIFQIQIYTYFNTTNLTCVRKRRKKKLFYTLSYLKMISRM